MRNEFLLIGSVVVIFGSVLMSYRIFGKVGLYVMMAVATILANIEVLMIVDAFSMEQTLGNVMFASTFLITDILSENESRQSAQTAVWLGVFTSVLMLIFTQYWLLYVPSANDWASEHITAIFSSTPRVLAASFLGYVISQRFDVWMYHKWWDFTTRKFGDKKPFLWLRNNASTLVSQAINTLIFTLTAFAGRYDRQMLISVMLSSYVIYIFTSLLDTPAVYLARMMKRRGAVGTALRQD